MPVVLPLADFLGILAAMLVILCAYILFRGFVQGLVNRIPVIGGTLSGVLDIIITDAVAWSTGQFKSMVSGFIGFILTPVHWLANHIAGIIGTFYALIQQVALITGVYLPTLRADLLSTLATDLNNVYAYVNNGLNAVEGYAASLVQGVYSYIGTQLQQVYGYIGAQLNALYQYVQTEVAGAEAYALALSHEAIAYTQTAVAGAEAYVQQVETTVITYTQAEVASLSGTISADITGVQAWAGSEITALQSWVAAQLTGVVSLVNTGITTVETTIDDLKTECTDNLCENLGPLANLFNDLTSVWTLAGIIALATEVAADPVGAGNDLNNALGGVVDATTSGLRSLIGI